jgi:hypothetical protein
MTMNWNFFKQSMAFIISCSTRLLLIYLINPFTLVVGCLYLHNYLILVYKRKSLEFSLILNSSLKYLGVRILKFRKPGANWRFD